MRRLLLITDVEISDIRSRLLKGLKPPRSTYPYIIGTVKVEEDKREDLFDLLSLSVEAINLETGKRVISSYLIIGSKRREDPYEAYEIVDKAYELALKKFGKVEISRSIEDIERFLHISGASGEKVVLKRLSDDLYKAFVPRGYSVLVYHLKDNRLEYKGSYPEAIYDRSSLQSALYEKLSRGVSLECVKIILIGKSLEP